LIDKGIGVVAVSRMKPKVKDTWNRMMWTKPSLDDASFDWLDDIIRHSQPEGVFHLASANFSTARKGAYIREELDLANRMYPLAIASAIVKWGLTRCHLIVPGSVHQYSCNDKEDVYINEHTPASPRNLYGELKQEVQERLLELSRDTGMKVACPVLFNHESAERRNDFLIPRIASIVASVATGSIMVKRENIYLPFRYDMSDAESVVDCMLKLCEYSCTGKYIVGSGKTVSLKTIQDVAQKEFGVDLCSALTSAGLFLKGQEDLQYNEAINNASFCCIADTQKVSTETGWSAKQSPYDMVKDIIGYQVRLLNA